jgi:1-acyl-sn-glycerol-3-phosphate acyltransferase
MIFKVNDPMSIKMITKTSGLNQFLRGEYNHEEWKNQRRFLRFLLKTLGFTLLVRLESVEGLENIPNTGPGILLMNHIGWVDPIVMVHVVPRYIVPLGKVEVFDYPVIGIFPKLWGAIPVQREGVDRRAIQSALEVLKKNELILVAPEGTRNPELQRAKGGFAYLASRSGAPIIPVGIEGSTGYPVIRYSRRWRESPITVKFGRPFIYREEYKRAGREQLRKLSDEAMYYLAALLPEERRGYYSDLTQATQDTFDVI